MVSKPRNPSSKMVFSCECQRSLKTEPKRSPKSEGEIVIVLQRPQTPLQNSGVYPAGSRSPLSLPIRRTDPFHAFASTCFRRGEECLHAKAPVPNINGNRALYLTCNPVRITWEMAPSEASVLLVRCKVQLQAPCLQNIWAYRESLPYNPSSPVVRMNHN